MSAQPFAMDEGLNWILILLLLPLLAHGAVIEDRTPRNKYFAEKAALLDPAGQHLVRNTFALTVPPGETWYVHQAMWVRLKVIQGEKNADAFFVRDLRQPLRVPEGTEIYGTNKDAFMWYSRPTVLIRNDPRYQDGEALYYERVDRLSRLPLYSLGNHREIHTTVDGIFTAASFPSDFTEGMIVHVSTHNLSWVALDNPQTGARVNTLSELDDARPIRFTGSMMVPFQRGMFTGIFLGHGAPSGVPMPQTGHGVVLFHKLPRGW